MSRTIRSIGTTLAASTFLTLLAALPASAGQDFGVWEFHPAYGHASLDGKAIDFQAEATDDFTGSGTAVQGTLVQSLRGFQNDSFPAFRLGYIWTRYLETEFTYDRNHTTGDYELHAYETSSGADITDVEGQVSAMFTTYQFAALIHP